MRTGMPGSGGGAVSVTPSACRGRQSGTMRGWALVAAVLLSAAALPEEDSPATPDYVELELGGEPARNRTRWDSRFVDAEGRFLAKIMATFILSKDLTRSFDYRIAKPALDIAIAKVHRALGASIPSDGEAPSVSLDTNTTSLEFVQISCPGLAEEKKLRVLVRV
ncbi:hypothetical protein HPB51_012173 [Rhipicephalus microplus]|uniref:Uncharacterized protein n=1 Tax=Rhipicephalus microplus TaxID=6941 RepID=A0A9J6D9S3_RHIMP|nr:hypothetical protein HPB51_012173 [Rhipicephalus microplus]